MLAYYLSRAALAGRNITWDQRHRLAIHVRDALEDALIKHPDAPKPFRLALLNTLRQLWIANGPYDGRTGSKIKMEFTRKQWTEVIEAQPRVTPADGVTQEELLNFMFDSAIDPVLIGRDGRNPITNSGSNFYVGVSPSDLKGFVETYPLNSRLVKIGERLVEEVYRTGRDLQSGKRPAPRGRYAKELRNVIDELKQAAALARPAQAKQLRHLINYFETGDPVDFEKFNTAWIEERHPIESMLGFIETDDDARGVKGTWEGIVMMPDAKVQDLFNGLRKHATYFEKAMPWDDQYKRFPPQFPEHEAWQVLSAHGDAGPDIPLGINLPNIDRLRREIGKRSILFTNVIRSTDEAMESLLIDEFAPVGERASARKCISMNSDLMLALHEILGHGTGQASIRLEDKSPDLFLKEFATAIEEARAELVALHMLWDPKIRSLYPEYSDQCAESALRSLVRRDLTMLRRVQGERIEDDHMRATRLIVSYATDKNAVTLKQIEGRTYQQISNLPNMRLAVKELLIEVMRIRAEGDYAAAKTMFQKHAFFFNTELRNEVTKRSLALSLPRYFAYVLPEVTATATQNETVLDAKLEYGDSFDAQMLKWSGKKH
jgi:dipeptidyl-peptidase-3